MCAIVYVDGIKRVESISELRKALEVDVIFDAGITEPLSDDNCLCCVNLVEMCRVNGFKFIMNNHDCFDIEIWTKGV